MYYQNDPKWKNKALNKSETVTIGSHGCLVTSLCNAYNHHHKGNITPLELEDKLRSNGGFTEGNLVIWSVASYVLDCTIQPWYNGEVSYDINTYYIANFLNNGTGHFTNVLRGINGGFDIFDVWDNKEKSIPDPRRMVQIIFK